MFGSKGQKLFLPHRGFAYRHEVVLCNVAWPHSMLSISMPQPFLCASLYSSFSFSVDEGVACDLYRSCRGVSLIATASIQSPLAFLDFLVSEFLILIIFLLFIIYRV